MAIQTTSLWAEGADRNIKTWAVDAFDLYPLAYPRLFMSESTTRGFEEFMNSSGVAAPTAVSPGETIPEADPTKGYPTRIDSTGYKEQIKVTYEEYKRNQYNIWEKRAKQLGEAFAQFKDQKAFSVLRNGRSLSTYYGDGVPLFSTLHPTNRVGGSTQSNISASSIPLDDTNLETGLLALRRQFQDDGKLINTANKETILAVPPALAKTAYILTESDGRPDTTDNDANYYTKGAPGSVTVGVIPWLGASEQPNATETGGNAGLDTGWYLIVPSIAELTFLQEEGFKLMSEEDFDSQVLKTRGTEFYGVGAKNWRGMWMSIGDDSTVVTT